MRKHSGFHQRIWNGMRLNCKKKANANNRTDHMRSLSAIAVIVRDNDVVLLRTHTVGMLINRQSILLFIAIDFELLFVLASGSVKNR